MIRRIESADRADYIKFAKEFYTSDAVTHDVPEEYLTLTFETLVEGNPFSDGYMIESDGENVGYALVAKTFSQEGSTAGPTMFPVPPLLPGSWRS